jgi:hypothetical protein
MSITFQDLAKTYRKKEPKIPLCCRIEFHLTIWLGYPRYSIDVGCWPKCPHMHCWFHRRKTHAKAKSPGL